LRGTPLARPPARHRAAAVFEILPEDPHNSVLDSMAGGWLAFIALVVVTVLIGLCQPGQRTDLGDGGFVTAARPRIQEAALASTPAARSNKAMSHSLTTASITMCTRSLAPWLATKCGSHSRKYQHEPAGIATRVPLSRKSTPSFVSTGICMRTSPCS